MGLGWCAAFDLAKIDIHAPAMGPNDPSNANYTFNMPRFTFLFKITYLLILKFWLVGGGVEKKDSRQVPGYKTGMKADVLGQLCRKHERNMAISGQR